MSCQPDTERRNAEMDGLEIDRALLLAAARYATFHSLYLSNVIENALVLLLTSDVIPAPVQFCAEHGCVLESNSSGTVSTACPVNEDGGRTDHAFIPENAFPYSSFKP